MSSERKWKILAVILLLTLLYTGRTTIRPIGTLNRMLLKYAPWKVLLAGYAIHFVCSHFLDILGLGAHDLPEHHYHRDFTAVRKVLTGLDAGIVSTLHIRNKFLRDTLSILLGAYYIVAPHQAENRMHRFHQQATIEGIRACWTKARHPILWKIAKNKQRSLINIHRRRIAINPIEILRLDSSQAASSEYREYRSHPIEAYLYFQGTDSELARATQLVINFPGGGFVTMNHLHHESYIQKWCNYLQNVAFLQIDYRKAPEHQYPAGFNDAYLAYRCVVDSKGSILDMNAQRAPMKVALSGDSAGGNFVAAVCCRAIVEGIQIPSGLLMAYPCLDLNMTLLRVANTAMDMKRNHTNTIARYSFLPTDVDKGDVLSSVDETPLNKYVESKEEINSILQNAQLELQQQQHNDTSPSDHIKRSLLRNKSGMHMFTSRVRFLNDGVLPITYLMLLGEAYVPDNADPINDMYLSPVKAPLHVLAKFPCTRIHVGTVDPLVDDSRRFTALLKYANQDADVKLLEWEGVSHAYLQCPTFLLPQARFSCELSVQWLSQMLNVQVVNPESFKYDFDKREKGLKDATDDLAFLRSRM